MPSKGSKNMELYIPLRPSDAPNKTVRSQLNASQKYDNNNVDNIRLRVPKGWKALMQDYVHSSDKYSSVNAMICNLIRQELEIKED